MRSDTGRAGGMAAAVIAGNVIALALTVVFARVLHAKGYGSFSALISTFIILMVPGTALPTTVAREVSAQIARGEPEPRAGVRDWLGGLPRPAGGVTVASLRAAPLPAAVPLR